MWQVPERCHQIGRRPRLLRHLPFAPSPAHISGGAPESSILCSPPSPRSGERRQEQSGVHRPCCRRDTKAARDPLADVRCVSNKKIGASRVAAARALTNLAEIYRQGNRSAAAQELEKKAAAIEGAK